ncbi:MAG: S8 family serine peptidase [Anaerolineae bacterium]|nr:S8 family serine peptidase [Anaerolineae bacterium]
MKRLPLHAIFTATLLLALLPGLSLAGRPPYQQAGMGSLPAMAAEVDPAVWETLRAEGRAEVIAVLRIQADLSGAAALPAREARGRYVYEALWAVAEATQRDLRAALDAQGAGYQPFYIVNALKVEADAALVRWLAARGEVARIVANPWVKGVPDRPAGAPDEAPAIVEQNLVRVGAPDAWALGYTGQGVVVAGNDTGIDWDHPALIDHYREQQPGYGRHDFNWHDAVHSGGGSCGADSPEPCDDWGHGTHTLGTVVGDDGAGNQIGMAPGAKWIGCRNMNVGLGSPVTYLECFEFFLAPYPLDGAPAQGDPALAPDVINNSWLCPPDEGCDPDTLEAAVEALRQAGIAVVVSAGNSGSSGCGSITNPAAIYQQSFTVGAFNHATDQIAGFSSRGPVTYAGQTYTKPDIAAPGVTIRSSVPGGGYASSGWSGTSMAAPHVTGAVALLLSAAPGYAGRVDLLEQALTSTAEPKLSSQCGDPNPPNDVWGWGILDVLAAVQLPAPPDAAFQSNSPICLGEPLLLTNSSAGADSWLWTFGDGEQSGEWEPAHTYAAAGQYTVTLAVTNTTASDQASALAVVDPLPVAAFHWTAADLTVTFGNDSQDAGAFLWAFGDGVTSTLPAPTHTYPVSNTYLVTLTAYNGCGQDAYAAAVPVTEGRSWRVYLPLVTK